MRSFHPRKSLAFHNTALRTVIFIVIHDLNIFSSSFPTLTPIQPLLPSYRVFTLQLKPAWSSLGVSSMLQTHSKSPCLHVFISYFSRWWHKIPNESNLRNGGFIWAHTLGHVFRGRQVIAAGHEAAGHIVFQNRKWWILVLSSPSPLYSGL